MRVGAPTDEEAGAAIGCSMASTVLPYRPSSLLPPPALGVVARRSADLNRGSAETEARAGCRWSVALDVRPCLRRRALSTSHACAAARLPLRLGSSDPGQLAVVATAWPGHPKRTQGLGVFLYKKIAFTTRSRDGKAVAAASGRNCSAGVVGPRSEACAAPNPCTQVTLCCTAESAYRSAACMLPIKGGGRRRGARSTTASASRRARAEEGLSSSSKA